MKSGFTGKKCVKINLLMEEYEKQACGFQSCVKISPQESLSVSGQGIQRNLTLFQGERSPNQNLFIIL